MTQPTQEQITAIRAVADAIVETVKEAGELGAPTGPMYAAMMAQGCTLNQFESITNGLVHVGRLRKEGDLFFIPKPA